MTRYVCSWCGRKQEGVNLTTCEDCPGPLEQIDRLGEQQREAREKLRKALLIPLDAQPSKPRYDPPRKKPTEPPRPPPPKLAPPVPKKPKPLTRKCTET